MLSKYQAVGSSGHDPKLFNMQEKMVLKTDSSSTSPIMRKEPKSLFNERKIV